MTDVDERRGAVHSAVERTGRPRAVGAGTVLYEQGNALGRVTLIRTGHAKVIVGDAEGRHALLAILGPGDLVGELSAIDGEAHSASVVALEEMEVVELSAANFRTMLEVDRMATLSLLRVLSGKLRRADGVRTELGMLDTTGRVCRRLLELASTNGSVTPAGVEITLPLSQDELAAWTGSSREAVARSLRALREGGAVRTSRRHLVITDVAALRRRGL